MIDERDAPELRDTVVLVTGGASGLGEAQVRHLTALGCRVVIADVDEARGVALASELGDRTTFVQLDVRDEAGWLRASTECTHWGLPVRGLVNNAGIVRWGGILERDVAGFSDELDVILLGAFLGLRAIVPLMETGGSIVNLSSSAGLRAQPGLSGYVAAKWGIRGLTRTAALEFADRGIRVNCILPGPVETAMLAQQTDEQREVRRSQVPMKRTGTPSEIADAVVFLLSARSSFMTGTDLIIDGGVTL